MSHRPLSGLVIALLPAAVAFAEVVRGTRSSSQWHPLGVVAFVWMLGAVLYYCRREKHLVRDEATLSLYSLGLFMLALLGLQPVVFALLTGGWNLTPLLHGDETLDLLYYSMSVALWIVVYLVIRREPGQRIDLHLRFNFRLADLGIFAFFAGLTFLVLTQYLLKLGGHHPPMHIFGVSRAAEPLLYFSVGALFTIVNALSEELWFRGLLLGTLRNLLPMWPAILLQALCFGLSHWVGTPQGILGLVLAGTWGIALGWWTYTRRSLWQALAVHLLADWLIFVYTNG